MSPETRSFKKQSHMEKQTIAATAADFKEILTVELGNAIKKSVIFYLDEADKSKKISPSEREKIEKEMIAENAWEHVLMKAGKYDASKGAKFRTWAVTVAKNFAKDQLKKLNNDPLHRTSHIESGYQKTETDEDVVSYVSVKDYEDIDSTQYWRDAYETFIGIVSNYSGRDREIAEMLIRERTKEEIMAETQMSGSLVDTCICRLRKRMRADLLKAGYSLAA